MKRVFHTSRSIILVLRFYVINKPKYNRQRIHLVSITVYNNVIKNTKPLFRFVS